MNNSPSYDFTGKLADRVAAGTLTQERYQERIDACGEVHRAYAVLSAALNRGDEEMILDALNGEHSTLLAKLFNTVLEAADNRNGDGRLGLLNMTLADLCGTGWGPTSRLSELRTPFI